MGDCVDDACEIQKKFWAAARNFVPTFFWRGKGPQFPGATVAVPPANLNSPDRIPVLEERVTESTQSMDSTDISQLITSEHRDQLK